jgi:hypothetical protein
MELDAAARALHEEIETALAETSAAGPVIGVLSVSQPAEPGPDTHFTVTLAIAGDRHTVQLPTGLALAYLADEEAAVDEWKSWIHRLRARLED